MDFVVDLRLVEEIIDLSQRSIRIFEGSCGELLASVHGWTIPVVRLWQTKTAAEDRMYGGVGFLVIVRDEDHYAGLFVDRIGKAAAQPGTEHPEGESEGDNFVTVETGASSTPENTGRALFDLDDIEGL